MASVGEIHTGPGVRELVSLIQISCVGALVFFAGRAGLKSFLKNRSDEISKKIVDARLELERLTHEAFKAREEISKISDTRKRMISEVEAEGHKLYDQLVLEAKQTAAKILEESKISAQNEFEVARRALKKEIVAGAMQQAILIASSDSSGNGDGRGKIHAGLLERFSVTGPEEISEKKNGIA